MPARRCEKEKSINECNSYYTGLAKSQRLRKKTKNISDLINFNVKVKRFTLILQFLSLIFIGMGLIVIFMKLTTTVLLTLLGLAVGFILGSYFGKDFSRKNA